MKHLMEEELIEAYYGGDEADAASREHLESCAACAQAYAALKSDLDDVKPVSPPARDERFGEQVWERIEPSLHTYTERKWSWRPLGMWRGLGLAAACALLLIGGFTAGRLSVQRKPPITVAKQPAPVVKVGKVEVVVLSDHLDRSERLLVELKHADTDSAEMASPMRDEARSLLGPNRVCMKNATQNGDPALATALDHLNRLLAQLADQREGLNSATIARLQEEMNADGLLFEVRVLRTRIPDRQTGNKAHLNGGTI
jgi:hypothetical protein